MATERAAEPLGGTWHDRGAERVATACGSRSTEQLRGLFAEAQEERQRQQYARADALYDALVAATCNVTSDHLELRMWAQYQHADMLMNDVAPQVEQHQGRYASDDVKNRAIIKFQDALQLSPTERTKGSMSGVVFGAAEQVHAHNSIGTLAMELGHHAQAIESFQQAIAVDADAYEPLGNLGLVLWKVGRLNDALEINKRALELLPDDFRLLHNMGTIYYEAGDESQAEIYWRRVLESHPDSIETLANLAVAIGCRGDPEHQSLLQKAEETTNPGQLQRSIDLQLALSHLRMIYDSGADIEASRYRYEAAIANWRLQGGPLPDPLTTIGSGSMGYYAIYQGYQDREIRYQFAQIYRENAGDYLDFVAPHVLRGRSKRYQFVAGPDEPSPPPTPSMVTVRRRIRVGFLSAFLRHHSVGLLLSGVMRYLARDQFEVVAIIFDDMDHDNLTKSVLESVDQSIVLPSRDLHRSQRLVASLELDVLVFSELGMHAASYFLAFARLALRSVVFWGHAITSGIDSVDYFVSSKLFRQHQGSTLDRERSTECLFEMEGLTTLFPRPPAPQTGLTRASFGLPNKSTKALMVLIPQTLYKLHADFDFIIQRILSAVESSFLVLPVGLKPLLVQQLTRRWRQGGIISAEVYRRIFFVRKMSQIEFLALCEMSDLVLDPFPVGGGRSSFEVFSVGTPILGITSRTTILQLTLAMYRRMDITTTCCMFETEDEVVAAAVELLQNADKRLHLRDQILRNNHKLYEGSNYPVVREWERFFKTILENDAPGPMRDDANGTRRACSIHEAVEGSLEPRLGYEMQVRGLTPGPALHSVPLFDHENPFHVASHMASEILPAAYLGKLLWNMQQRFLHRVVDAFVVKPHGFEGSFAIEIREGDDLHQVVRWQVRRALEKLPPESRPANVDDLASQALAIARVRVPQHTSHEWRAARAMVPPRDYRKLTQSRERDCVALVVTTCKRLALFLRTMVSLSDALGIAQNWEWHDWFCAVIVIDDNSSKEDRRRMQAAYPSFRFIFKSTHDKGHARSLNLALHEVQGVRFLFYLEDDWSFRRHPSTGRFLLDALAILRSTPLTQVLINDQLSGYASQLTTEHGHVVQYAIHEFAVADPSHAFSYWPGFSLNPGVWDLHKLSIVLRELNEDGVHGPFQEDTDIFEREFSLRVWRAGLEIGYLKGDTVCDHIGAPPGTNASAYVLNGLPRRFD